MGPQPSAPSSVCGSKATDPQRESALAQRSRLSGGKATAPLEKALWSGDLVSW